jgi:hypothetical protein
VSTGGVTGYSKIHQARNIAKVSEAGQEREELLKKDTDIVREKRLRDKRRQKQLAEQRLKAINE